MKILLLCMGCLAVGFALGIICMAIYMEGKRSWDKINLERSNRTINILHQWLILKEKGVDLSYMLEQRKIKRIAVYGMGILGRHLVRELQHHHLESLYGIDRRRMPPFQGMDVYTLKEGLPEADMVINTVIAEHQGISAALGKYFKCPIVCLEDIVFESYPIDK